MFDAVVPIAERPPREPTNDLARPRGGGPSSLDRLRGMTGTGPCDTSAVLVAGVPVDDVTMEEAVDVVLGLVEDGRTRGISHQVATVNVDFIVNAQRDRRLMSILRRAALAVPDGMPVVWGAWALGGRLRERVTGADLVPALVAGARDRDLQVLLYGAGPGIAERAAEILRERVPGARIVGDAGPADAASVTDIAELGAHINAAPDICCVAFGNPRQEYFIESFGHRLGIPVMIGIGGTLDFIVGAKRRAPRWAQRFGLEWLHRAVSEPRRLPRRYARDAFVFLPAIARQVWASRRAGRSEMRCGTSSTGEVTIDLTGEHRIDQHTALAILSVARNARRQGSEITIVGLDERDAGGVSGLPDALRDLADGPTADTA